MGWLFRATHLALEEQVAVKLLYPQLMEDDEFSKRFLDEARIQFKLKHSHIVQVTDVINGELLGTVMEWVDGKDLHQHLFDVEQLALPQMWDLCQPIFEAVHYIHEQGLVHRDLKPANILLQRNQRRWEPKITDFGIAKIMDNTRGVTETGQALGTSAYMSPEQVRDSKNIDRRADIYSLGVLLYQMSTGRLPFEGNERSILVQQLNDPPPPPSTHNQDLNPSLEYIIMRCLNKEADKRYETCEELAFAVGEVVAEHTPSYSIKSTIPMQALSAPAYLDQEPKAGKGPIKASIPPPPTTSKGPSDLVLMLLASIVGLLLTAVVILLLGPKRRAPRPHQQVQSRQAPADAGVPPSARTKRAIPPTRAKTPPAQPCLEGSTRECYSGPPKTASTSPCRKGTQTCRQGEYGPCIGEQTPQKERCNGKDDNCDGRIDETFAKKGRRCLGAYDACKLPGRWRCHPDQTRLTCVLSKRSGRPRRGWSRLLLRTTPSEQAFFLQYNKQKRMIKGRFCIELKAPTPIKLWHRGYSACHITLPTRSGALRLQMKVDTKTRPEGYCSQP